MKIQSNYISKNPLLGVENINAKLLLINKKHVANLWISIPVIAISIFIMTWILENYDNTFTMKSYYYVFGVFSIIFGSAFLITYNYLSIIPINFHDKITDSAINYLSSIENKIKNKLKLLFLTSLAYCVFLSIGIQLLVFRLISDELLNGVIGAYYGLLSAFYGYSVYYIVRRFNNEYGEILLQIKNIKVIETTD